MTIQNIAAIIAILLLIAIGLLFFGNKINPTGNVVAGEAAPEGIYTEPPFFFYSILVTAGIILLVLWYYFSRVMKEFQKGN